MTPDQRHALLVGEAPADDQRDLLSDTVLKALNDGELREVVIEAAIEALNRGYVTLSPSEAAKALGCGERFLRDGCNQRGFPYIDLGKAKRFGPEELRAIQDMCRVPARPSLLAKARRANKARPS